MKLSKIFCVSWIIAFSLIVSSVGFCQEFYSKGNYRLIRSNIDGPLVASVNVMALVQKYANDFSANLVASQQNSVVEYDLYRKSDQQGITIMIGLHPSIRDAEESMLDALNYQNIIMKESPGEKIGESAWSRPPTYGPPAYAFIRNNVVVYLTSSNASTSSTNVDIISICRSIDHDLINGAPYVIIQDKISPPVINSIDLSKPVLNQGERCSLSINAIDPNGRRIILYGNSLRDWGGVENESIIGWNDPRVLLILHDEQLSGSHTIKCWVVNEDNLFSQVKEVQVTFLAPSAVNFEDAAVEIPQVFTLFQNAPNPFNPSTMIGFALMKSSTVCLKVYDLLGREVVTLSEGDKPAGQHRVVWNGSDNRGKQVSSGIYLYRLIAGGKEETRKMLIAR